MDAGERAAVLNRQIFNLFFYSTVHCRRLRTYANGLCFFQKPELLDDAYKFIGYLSQTYLLPKSLISIDINDQSGTKM